MPEKLFDKYPAYRWTNGFMESSSRGDNEGYDLHSTDPHSSAVGRFQLTKGAVKDWGAQRSNTPLTKENQDKIMEALTLHNFHYLYHQLGRIPTCDELYIAHNQGLYGAFKIFNNPYDYTNHNEFGGGENNGEYHDEVTRRYYVEGKHDNLPESAFPKDDSVFRCEVTTPSSTERHLPSMLYGNHQTHKAQPSLPHAPFTENSHSFSATNPVTSQNIQKQNQIPNPLARSLGFKYLTDEYIHNSIRDFPLFNTNSPPK